MSNSEDSSYLAVQEEVSSSNRGIESFEYVNVEDTDQTGNCNEEQEKRQSQSYPFNSNVHLTEEEENEVVELVKGNDCSFLFADDILRLRGYSNA